MLCANFCLFIDLTRLVDLYLACVCLLNMLLSAVGLPKLCRVPGAS